MGVFSFTTACQNLGEKQLKNLSSRKINLMERFDEGGSKVKSKNQKDWNIKNIREALEKWMTSFEMKENLYWYHDSDSEPLDLENPRIKITFNQLENRRTFNGLKVTNYCFNCIFQ